MLVDDDKSDVDERNNNEGSDDEGNGAKYQVMHPTYIYSSRTFRSTDRPHRLSTFALTDVRRCVLGDGVWRGIAVASVIHLVLCRTMLISMRIRLPLPSQLSLVQPLDTNQPGIYQGITSTFPTQEQEYAV